MQKIFFLLSAFIPVLAFSQGASSTFMGLNKFLNTEFIQKYEEARNRAEQSVRDFKAIQGEFSEDDINAVMDAYNASAEQFNQVLYKIKDDLLNKQKTQIHHPISRRLFQAD